MNNPTTNDLRYLDVTRTRDRYQIESHLCDMGTNPEVIFWFFSQVDELKAEYTKQLLTEQQAYKFDMKLQ